MGFKEQLEKDIAGVFINPGEFATEHNVDGENVLCVVDDDIMRERKGLDPKHEYDGVFSVEKMLYIAESFFIRKPVEGQRLVLDHEYFYVKNVSANAGMLELELERNDT